MRSASGGPSSATTVVAVRCGKRERSVRRPGGRSSAAAAPTTAGQRPGKQAPAAQGGDPGRDARAGGEAERPPEGAVHLFGLDPRLGSAELAQARGHPLRRHPLALGRGGAVDGGQRLDQIAQPIRVEMRRGACAEARVAPVAIGGETYRLIHKMGPCRRAAR